jgi:hypothetical protein
MLFRGALHGNASRNFQHEVFNDAAVWPKGDSLSGHDLDKSPIFDAVASSPVLGLAFEERANCAEITLMSQKVCLFLTFGPEFNGV